MFKSKKAKLIDNAMKNIFKAITNQGLNNAEAITCLEMAKLDIILNAGLVILDGQPGASVFDKGYNYERGIHLKDIKKQKKR